MAHYTDLSFFRYEDASWIFKDGFPYILLNIGWLDQAKDYPKGDLLEKDKILYFIFQLCRHPVILHRGFHACNLCDSPQIGIRNEKHNETEFAVGNGSIMVKGKNNLLYVAPTMIFHYIKEHNYLPPEEFIEALLSIRLDWNHFQNIYKNEN